MAAERGSAVERPLREPWRRLEGKVVMVTGASAGIGREICLDLAEAGCIVIAAARRLDRLESLCEEINRTVTQEGSPLSRAASVDLDLSADGSAIDRCVQKAWDCFGRIDALVNNAGVRGAVRSPLDLTEEEWHSILGTNLTGTWLVTKSVCRRMKEAGRKGSVINISSISGLNRGQKPGSLHYSVSKTGVNCMTRVMGMELAPIKIRVNSISPGLFKSDMTAGLMKKEWLSKVTERTVPLRNSGTVYPALTSAVRYLIHDSSEYVTGNNFIVDSGATIPGIPIFSSL